MGTALRALRIRRGWRQVDLAARALVSPSFVSRLEHGNIAAARVRALRRVADALGARIEVLLRWQGADLDRLVNARHSAMHELVARTFAVTPGWEVAPEVSFSIYGERGVIDVVAWHAARRVLLVVELKTEIVDVQDLVGSVDRKRRLARRAVAERGWKPETVSTWVAVAESRTNRRRLEAHRAMLRNAFPTDGRAVASWIRDPSRPLAALSFLSDVQGGRRRSGLATPKRVRPPRSRSTSKAESG